jgi:hypothetical protein
MNVVVEYETEIPVPAVPLVPDIAIQRKKYPPFIQAFQSSDLAAGGGRKGFLIFSFDTINPMHTFKIDRADFGTTHLYGPASTRRRAGGFWWDHELMPAARPLLSKALVRTVKNLDATVLSSFGGKSIFKFEVHGQLPFMPYKSYTPDYWVRAAIDGEFTLEINSVGQRVNFELNGKHDGFPKHMIRINKKDTYVHDPLKTGDSPISLMGAMEKSTHQSGIIF